ncbi:MAG: glycerate kinase [Rickettsiales bacterium]|nr:glycerate kinase [Rickettsiales bacterium]
MNNLIESFEKKQVLELFLLGLESTKPINILHKHVILNDRYLKIINSKNNIYKSFRYIFPIAIGKASVQMAESFNKLIDSRKYIKKGLVIVNEENFKKVKNFKCLSSGHPLPNKKGIKATSYLVEKLKKTEKNDIIILMLSGGGSAMLPYPAEGISLSEKIYVNKILLECGAKIQEINAVRKHISRIKGGNFLRFSTPSYTHTLIISDVIGDDLSSIASGLTVPDHTTFRDVIKICKKYKIFNKIPQTVQDHLIKGDKKLIPETPKKEDRLFEKCQNYIISSNSKCVYSIKKFLDKKKITSKIFSLKVTGEVKSTAEKMVKSVKNKKGPMILLFGGETTVQIKGKGIGGRNQELALYFALFMQKYNPKQKYIFLSGGTDGRDGPTDSAGGIVDETTILKCNEKKIDLLEELENNNSYYVLKQINSHIIIGGTDTNVADIQILLLR